MFFKELIKDVIKPVLHYKYRKEFYYWKIKYRNQLLTFKDIHVGEDCFIIGNGPSLKNMNLNLLDGYNTFVLNKAHLLKDLYDFRFSYHVCVDDIILEQIHEIIESGRLECPSFISHLHLKSPLKNEPHINRLYTDAAWSFYRDISLPICIGYTVTYVAMQIAYYMGFKRIFLIGVDHNWAIANEPNSINKLENNDINHFHPDYFKGQNWHSPDKDGNEASYALAKHFFHSDGRDIFDATINGKLNIFHKISFEDALQMAQKSKLSI